MCYNSSTDTQGGASRLADLWEQYLDLGFSIIPIKPRSKQPAIPSWREYMTRRPNRDEVLAWIAETPDCGFAIVTGKVSGVVGFDCDSTSVQPPLPATLSCRSGKGRHYYYRLPVEVTLRTHKIEGVEGLDTLRGEGSYLIAPPSVHPSGAVYTWEGPLSLESIAPLPEAFIPRRDWQAAQKGAPEGARNDSLTSYIGKVLRALPEELWDDQWDVIAQVAARAKPPITPDTPDEWKKLHDTFESIKRAERERRSEDTVKVTALDTVTAESVQFLWYPYLPIGKLTVVEGHPGEGKTWLMLAIAAAITKGGVILPTQSLATIGQQRRIPPANVIYMTAEDGLADTIRPRFDRLGGDPARMLMLEERSRKGKLSILSLSEDLDLIEKQVESYRPLLVVVDPLDAYLGEKVDFFRANEVRPVLARIGSISAKHGIVFVIVRHYAKAPKERAILKGQGTVAIAAAARSLLQVGSLRDLPQHYAFSHEKCNVAPKGASIEFAVTDEGFSWVGPNEFVTSSTLNAPEPVVSQREEASTSEDAVTFLREYLIQGPRPVEEVYKQGKAKLRLPATAISRAKHTLRLKVSKSRDDWYWSLP